MTDSENLARLSAAAWNEWWSSVSTGANDKHMQCAFEAGFAAALRSGRLILLTDGEYICKCGLRVEPHRCRDTKGEF